MNCRSYEFCLNKKQKRIPIIIHLNYLSDPKAWDDKEWELENPDIPLESVTFRANPISSWSPSFLDISSIKLES